MNNYFKTLTLKNKKSKEKYLGKFYSITPGLLGEKDIRVDLFQNGELIKTVKYSSIKTSYSVI